MDSMKNRVVVYVSGNRFVLKRADVALHPDSLLADLILRPLSGQNEDLVFDRPVPPFTAVVSYYQTGKLHMPPDVCPEAFNEELEFWGFEPRMLEHCCLFKYLAFVDEVQQTKRFQKLLSRHRKFTGVAGKQTLRERTWSIIDNQETTILAKVYLWVALGFVLLSMASIALGTLPAFNKSLTTCQLLELMKDTHQQHSVYIEQFLEEMNCDSNPEDYWEQWLYDYFYESDYDDYSYGNASENTGSTNQSISMQDLLQELPQRTVRLEVFQIIDYIVVAFFTIELFLRLMSCPSIRAYFKSIINCIDLVILIAAYIYITVEEIHKRYKYENSALDILVYFNILRAFRIVRVLQNVAAMKVLIQCIKTNYKDLLILLLLVSIGVNFFANIVYFVEDKNDFNSIPQAWWWGVVTMTTVGYGDLYPKTTIGKVAGSLCALSGVVSLALVIPVFVNTFVSLYQFAQLHDKLNESTKSRDKPVKKSKLSQIEPTTKENI